MLSRTADNLYWLGRHMERAENAARLLGGIQRLSLLPIPSDEQKGLWQGLYQSDEERAEFKEHHDEFAEQPVLHHMALDLENPSSIKSCIFSARENVRAARHVLTTEISQCMNQIRMEVRAVDSDKMNDMGVQEFLDLVKERAHLFRGVIYGTMRRGEPFMFWEMGAALERSENTSRLMLARSTAFRRASKRDDGFEFYRWGTFLRTANAYSAFRQLYRDVDPVSVAHMLILNPEIPRSLVACVDDIARILRFLRAGAACVAMADQLAAEVRGIHLDRVMRIGIDDFLMDFRKRVHELSDQIQLDFMMVR